MSFERMQDVKEKVIHEREVILAYGFTPVEKKQLQTVLRLAGIKEILFLSEVHLLEKIRNLLDGSAAEKENNTPIKEKVIVFNNIERRKINIWLEMIKKYRIKRPLSAVVTEDSIDWTMAHLISNLQEERTAFSENKIKKH